MNGTESSTAQLDRSRVAEAYARNYRPGNATLLVVGDVTPDEALALLEPRLGGWAPRDVPPLPVAAAVPAAGRSFVLVDKPGAAQSVIRIGNVGASRNTPDYYALQVLNTLLGGSFTSRLNRNLRETHGYTYGAGSTFEMRRLAGPFRASASVATAVTSDSIVQFLKELRAVRDEPILDEELVKTRRHLGLSLPGEFETSASAARNFAELLVNDLPADAWDRYVDGVSRVTSDDVQRVARHYIDPDHFVMVVVGDRIEIEAGLEALHEGPVHVRDLLAAVAGA